jgi:hypothetical protein
MKRPRLNPIVSPPRKTKITPIKQWQSTMHAPLGEGQGGAAVKETPVKPAVKRQWQKHRNLTAYLCLGRQQSAWSAAGL